jgi:predicted amino acid racemase
LGTESAYGERIEGTYGDAFTFSAEIIELKEKPSAPIGEIGMDAFGGKPVFEDKGIIKRAIVAAGRQDVKHEGLTPRDKGITILGASSDHMILDVTNAERQYSIGDAIEFDVSYGALLAAATSEYVNKIVK